MLKFIIHLSTIYINLMFTVYLINVGWGCYGWGHSPLRLCYLNVAGLPKVRETLLQNPDWLIETFIAQGSLYNNYTIFFPE